MIFLFYSGFPKFSKQISQQRHPPHTFQDVQVPSAQGLQGEGGGPSSTTSGVVRLGRVGGSPRVSN